MSQAVTVIFAEYFGLEQQVDRNGISGLLTDRVALLEQEFASLKCLIETRLQGSDGLLTTQNSSLPSEPPKAVEVAVENNSAVTIGLPSESPNELPNEDSNLLKEGSGLQLILLNEPHEIEPHEVKPIPGTKLSELRFGLSPSMVSLTKSKKSIEEFTKWTKEKDPDGIAWKMVESPSKGYVPVTELPDELKTKLLQWMAERLV